MLAKTLKWHHWVLKECSPLSQGWRDCHPPDTTINAQGRTQKNAFWDIISVRNNDLEKAAQGNLGDPGWDKGFLGTRWQMWFIKEKNQLGSIKLENPWSSKYIVKTRKRQATGCEKYWQILYLIEVFHLEYRNPQNATKKKKKTKQSKFRKWVLNRLYQWGHKHGKSTENNKSH